MKPDITSRNDIDIVVRLFYNKVKEDEFIGDFFTKIIRVNWAKHLPVMGDFWENILFHSGNYQGDPLSVHKQVHQMSITTKLHFERWLLLFNQTIDENFTGPTALFMKQRANGIATVMLAKITR
jgi:hemoglobin